MFILTKDKWWSHAYAFTYIYLNKILYNIFSNRFCKYICVLQHIQKLLSFFFIKLSPYLLILYLNYLKLFIKNLQNLNFLWIPVEYRIVKGYQILNT